MKKRKGIILAGGLGKRLYPLTLSISKQILPIYDKPMIYYPLYVLIEAKIRDILIITTPRDHEIFKTLLGDGSQWGINLKYKTQEKPNGIAEAFILGEDFIGNDDVVLILGDNIFYGEDLSEILRRARTNMDKATIFSYYVKNPSEYGVVEIGQNEKVISIEEKPINPKSNYIITGLYFYTKDVIDISKNIKKSSRGELEITSVNEEYFKMGKLKVEKLDEKIIWFDTGTPDALIKASNFIKKTEKRLKKQICCPEEGAYKNGWISSKKLLEVINQYEGNTYGEFLKSLVLEKMDVKKLKL